MRLAGLSPLLAALSGLLLWALHFGLVYAAHAIACERGLAGHRLLGLPLVPALVLAATALAGLGRRAWRRLGPRPDREAGEDDPLFLPWFTAAITLLAALAILWQASPALLLQPCG